MSQNSKPVSLKIYNTFGIDAIAENLVEVTNYQDLKNAYEEAASKRCKPIVLGGGSNVLFVNQSYEFIIVNRFTGIEIIEESDDFVFVKSGAGEVWHDLVMYCINQNLGGVENLSLIPGTVGAAPMQNIGAYGVEIKEVFESLEAIELSTFKLKNFNNIECGFGYRESVFKKELKGKYFITSVTLKLAKEHVLNTSYGAISEVLGSWGISNPSIKDVSDAVIHIRESKLPNPIEIGNAGSFFKNPVISDQEFEQLKERYPDIPSYAQEVGRVKVPAGWLIEQCGWKGTRVGSIGVHDRQSLVLVNHGGGDGSAIKDLASKIQHSVAEKFDIQIIPEVNIL